LSRRRGETADLERRGSIIGGFVVREFLRLLEDPPDGCRQSLFRWGRGMKREGVPELFLLREVADIGGEMLVRRSPRPPRDEHAHPEAQGPTKEK
jgi:hypothetical protein